MKTLFKLIIPTVVVVFSLMSCNRDARFDSSMFYPNVLVTVKSANGGICYFQLDDATTLKPVNVQKSPFGGKEVRALANVIKTNDKAEPYNQAVKVNWIDSIRTKLPVPSVGTDNDKKYGTAPIEIVNNWVTIVEDGYLTICFYGMWGTCGKVHYVNLLTGTNPEDPYELELRHDSNGDLVSYGREATGLIAFNIRNLPDTQGKTVKLKIKYQSFSGNKKITFNYCTGKTKIVKNLPYTALQNVVSVR